MKKIAVYRPTTTDEAIRILQQNAGSQFGNSAFGQINNQANNMRMMQFTFRFGF